MLTLSAAVRHDRVNMDFSDDFSGASGGREFSETTGMAGLSVRLGRGTSAFFRYSQSFQTPTVNDLFAFPLFGSNPDLESTVGDTYEGGVRAALGDNWSLQAALFRMDLENEVVFVITDPIRFIGSNQNVGRSRRAGLEIQLEGVTSGGLNMKASYSYIRAENLSLAEELEVSSLRIPLVPEHKFSLSAGYSVGLLRFRGDLLYVGGQVLSSDNANSGPKLDAYTVVNLGAAYDLDPWTFRLEIRNAMDEDYETRGFFSFGTSYLTPAPGRQVVAALELRY